VSSSDIRDRPRRSAGFLWLVTGLGLAGVASLALAPLEQALPPGVDVPPLLLLLQPALLVLGLAALGWIAAPRVGLDAPVLGALADGGEWRAPLKAALQPALLGGALCAAVLLVYGLLSREVLATTTAPDFEVPLVARVLYGGVTEEILLRWGVMSGLAWLFTWLRRPLGLSAASALWVANAWAAGLFALGHLPTLFVLLPMPPDWLVALVVGANAMIGMVLGWLYMRRGLECAMLAHAAAHLLALGTAALLDAAGLLPALA